MNRSREKRGIGSLEISKEVICAISEQAALEIDGVISLARPKVRRGLERGEAAVILEKKGETICLTLSLHINKWAVIPSLAEAVQRNVKKSVEELAGIPVSKVNISIVGS